MLNSDTSYDIVLRAEDIEEEVVPQDTGEFGEQDYAMAVGTAQEMIRQRGIMMEDLEKALNACRRYLAIMKDNHLPDPNAAVVRALLAKYKMDGPKPRKPEPKRPELESPRAELEQGT